ncbi:MAG: lipoate--protein ligase family protein [Planctomycetota bacterium]|jgi:lipoate-protein ligase A
MGFRERWPELIVANPGGADDPLGESILDLDAPGLRVFEPPDVRLVVGRNQDPTREFHIDHAQVDGVPIHRRVTGGGAVVLAPGMVVVALRMPLDRAGVDCYFDRVNGALIPAIAGLTSVPVACRGHGDLAVCEADGVERKILGASLRQAKGHAYYLGVLMVADALPLIERYCASPSRQPDYRAGRDHAAFCTSLGVHGVSVGDLRSALAAGCAPLTGR